jgi:hypothetical protein
MAADTPAPPTTAAADKKPAKATAKKQPKAKKPAKAMNPKKPAAKKPAESTKSDAVRYLASAMKARGEKPRPSVIVAELKKQGIDVAAAQVSMVLKKMGFRRLRRRKKAVAAAEGKAIAVKAGLKKASVVSVDDLIAAKKVAGSMGGTDKAIAALQALKKFEG